MIKITEESYNALVAEDLQAWVEDEFFYTDLMLIPEDKQNLVEKVPVYKIWDYTSAKTDPTIWPGDLDFTLFNLLPKDYVAMGLRVKTIWFNDKSEPIVKIEYTFTKDEGKQSMHSRAGLIYFRLDNDTWGERTKPLYKEYNTSLKKRSELKARRTNIIDQLASLADDMGIGQYVEQLFELYSSDVYTYKQSGSSTLRESILNSDLPWLDANLPNGNPARATIVYYLDSAT